MHVSVNAPEQFEIQSCERFHRVPQVNPASKASLYMSYLTRLTTSNPIHTILHITKMRRKIPTQVLQHSETVKETDTVLFFNCFFYSATLIRTIRWNIHWMIAKNRTIAKTFWDNNRKCIWNSPDLYWQLLYPVHHFHCWYCSTLLSL